jgi:hypothetical protein
MLRRTLFSPSLGDSAKVVVTGEQYLLIPIRQVYGSLHFIGDIDYRGNNKGGVSHNFHADIGCPRRISQLTKF